MYSSQKKDGKSRADDMKICQVSEICGEYIKVFGHDYELSAGNLTPVYLTPDILNPAVFIEENGSYRFKEVRLIFRKNLTVQQRLSDLQIFTTPLPVLFY
ncbi:MAG: hypothetical protein KA821_08645 [Chitinophagaceae bacterium]|nr:hypothetical protein [Chitinophagaceae bacterium]